MEQDKDIEKINDTEWKVWHGKKEATVILSGSLHCSCSDFRWHKKCKGVDKVKAFIKAENEALRRSQQRPMF